MSEDAPPTPPMAQPPARDPDLAAMWAMVRGFQLSVMLREAAELGLADRVAAGPRPVAALAEEVGVGSQALLRLCRALAAFGVFALDAEGRLSHTARSAWLRSDARPTLHHAARYFTAPGNWGAWGAWGEALRGEACPFEAVFGRPNFEHLAANPDEAALSDAFMRHSPDDRHAAVAEALDMRGAALVVDVGGGEGALLAALLAAHPAPLRGLLYDRPQVVAGAGTVLGTAGVAGRCSVEAGDFFARVPEGGDVYLLSQVLHDWDDAACGRILGRCRAAMRAGARLVVIERVLPPMGREAEADPGEFLADTHMMAILHGRERTAAEFGALLEAAGFAPQGIRPTRSPFRLVEARAA
jgi:O-methyltransferase domain